MFESWRISDKNRAIVQGTATELKPPWKPSIPELNPWRDIYMRLSRKGQQRWNSMSPRQREQAFGI